MSFIHKVIIKEMVDHKLIKSNMESLSWIDDFVGLENKTKEVIEDEIFYNLKVWKLHNILQLKHLQDKMREEYETKAQMGTKEEHS